MFDFDTACEYEKLGRLKRTSMGDFDLFTYTQDEFFNKDNWDEVTRNHRGTLYYKGVQVSKPFEKFFNMDEMPETEHDKMVDMMDHMAHYTYDKANGHLLFVVNFFDSETSDMLVKHHLKGTLDPDKNDMLKDDLAIWYEKFDTGYQHWLFSQMNPVTLMFEAIVSHDPHTLYDIQSKQYGEDTFVLLGGNEYVNGKWRDINRDRLEEIAITIGTPIIEERDLLSVSLKDAYEHRNMEGYVIHFPQTNFRFKIKTKDYWAQRFKKDLQPERVIRMLRAGGEHRIKLKLPEEVANDIVDVLKKYIYEWHLRKIVYSDSVYYYRRKCKNGEFTLKDVHLSDDLTKDEKAHVTREVKDEDHIPALMNSKKSRTQFMEDILGQFGYDNDHMYDRFSKELIQIVDKIGMDN